MRLSVEKTDKGYRPDAHKFDVYLDGVKLNDCITADDVLGEAIVAGMTSPHSRIITTLRLAIESMGERQHELSVIYPLSTGIR